MQAYEYPPIIHDDHIRLLDLDAGFGKSKLSGRLRTVSLSRTLTYEALSYTWGTPVFSKSIQCSENSHIAITSNLGAALRQFRHRFRKRTMWIDAICVDQQNLLERNHQVRHMRKIYEQAERVLIWLGEDSGIARLAFRGLNELSKIVLATEEINDLEKSHRSIKKFRSSRRGLAFASLLKCSWFRRIWVIQEVTCARQATLCCGEVAMDWDGFIKIARRLFDKGLDIYFVMQLREILHHLAALYGHRHQWKQRKGINFLELLDTYRVYDASDARDKVFALAGLAIQWPNTTNAPDYSKDVTDVYQDWALDAIITNHNVDVLTNCSLPDRSQERLPVPTWTPDWSRPLGLNPSSIVAPGAYSASKKTDSRGSLGKDKRILLLDGLLLNQIELLGQHWYQRSGLKGESRAMKTLELLTDCEILFKGSKLYAEQDKQSFLRTLTSDVDRFKHRTKDQDLITAYEAFCTKCKEVSLRSSKSALVQGHDHERPAIVKHNRTLTRNSR